MQNNYSYFQNRECEYFPCHKAEKGFFNCLFCYCPLYMMGEECGGNFVYTKEGIKDCSECLIPHSEDGYRYITEKCRRICKDVAESE